MKITYETFSYKKTVNRQSSPFKQKLPQSAAVSCKVLFLIQGTCLGNGLGITVKQDTAQYDGKQAVAQSSDQTLCEDQAGILFVDDDIADRRNQNPGNRIGDQIGDDEGRDLFC